MLYTTQTEVSVAMQQLSDGRDRFDRRPFARLRRCDRCWVGRGEPGKRVAHADLTKEQRDKMTADEIIQQ